MTTKRQQVYKCALCGNITEVVHASVGELVCCGQPMNLQEENTTDAAKEKHVPVVEKIEGGYKVTVGSVSHPMEEAHYIEWIQLVAGDKAYTQFFKAGDMLIILNTVHIWKHLPVFQDICIACHYQADLIFCQSPDQVNTLLADETIFVT